MYKHVSECFCSTALSATFVWFVNVWMDFMALGEHLAQLLCNPDERGPAAELFEFGCSYICARGAQATQDVSDGVLHVTFIRHLHCPAFRCPTETKSGSGHHYRFIFSEK